MVGFGFFLIVETEEAYHAQNSELQGKVLAPGQACLWAGEQESKQVGFAKISQNGWPSNSQQQSANVGLIYLNLGAGCKK